MIQERETKCHTRVDKHEHYVHMCRPTCNNRNLSCVSNMRRMAHCSSMSSLYVFQMFYTCFMRLALERSQRTHFGQQSEAPAGAARAFNCGHIMRPHGCLKDDIRRHIRTCCLKTRRSTALGSIHCYVRMYTGICTESCWTGCLAELRRKPPAQACT